MSRAKVKEFGLSDEVPEAVQEMDLKRAQDAWQARSDAAAAAIALPPAPYRIMGVEQAGAWFIEEASVVRSDMPRDPYDSIYSIWALRRMVSYGMSGDVEDARKDRAPYIALLDRDRPTAALEWRRVGKKRKGWFTYARARAWLREYLEPVRDESTYFRADGSEA